MKTCGIIAEFNPLHKGHEYLISKAKTITSADYAVIVMSGDYVQRGEPAIIDKYIRTKLALLAGGDLVIELPCAFATGSAQYFARCAVSILNNLGIIDYLVFGSESGDIKYFENLEYSKDRLDSSNNILGREYVNAINYFNSSITPVTIKRLGSDYNSLDITPGEYASASYIRNHLCKESLEQTVPEYVTEAIGNHLSTQSPVYPNDYSEVLLSTLIREKSYGFDSYFDVYSDLSMKLIDKLNYYTSFSDYISLLKSKDITYSHISRALMHIVLGIKKDLIESVIDNSYKTYARILGFNKKSDKVLSAIKNNTDIPLISKLADSDNQLSNGLSALLNVDINGSHIHSYLANRTKNKPYVNEYTRPIIII